MFLMRNTVSLLPLRANVRTRMETNEVMIMAEDKDTLKEWFTDMKTLSDQSKEISDQIKSYQRELQVLQQERILNDSQRKEYAQKVLGKAGTDEEVLTALKDELQEIYQREMQASFENSVSKCVSRCLSTGVKTTPIMDAFYHSKDPFLVLRHIHYFIKNDPYWGAVVDLIIAKSVDCPEVNKSCPTLTEIKTVTNMSGVFYIDELEKVIYYAPQRMEALITEIYSLLRNMESPKHGDMIAFKVPFEIGGQTYRDQTGYGSYYDGDVCLYEGTYYGQTTSFYVVGIIVNMR
jgi:hypothetical protein